MYNNTLSYAENHAAWGQRIRRELGAQQYYVSRGYVDPAKLGVDASAYQDGFESARAGKAANPDSLRKSFPSAWDQRTNETASGPRAMQTTWLSQSTQQNAALAPSYPVPFKRVNQDQKEIKRAVGYMNDGSGSNPSDPNSMQDQGFVRNAVYNAAKLGIPSVRYQTQSGALGYHDPGQTNNSFYSFGASHTNIRSQLKQQASDPNMASMEHIRGSPVQYSQLLNKKLYDVRHNTIDSRPQNLVKPPNCLMNDYTKNISQSIFTPGVHHVPTKTNALRAHFAQSKQGTGKLDNSKQRLFDTSSKGMGVAVAGRIGAKYLALFDGRKSAEDIPENGTFVLDEEIKSRPKSSYAGSVAASRIKSRAATEVRTRASKNRLFTKLKAKQLGVQIQKEKADKLKLQDDIQSVRSTINSLNEQLSRTIQRSSRK